MTLEYTAAARWQRWHDSDSNCYIVSFWDDPLGGYEQFLSGTPKRYVHGTYVAQGLLPGTLIGDLTWFMNWEAT